MSNIYKIKKNFEMEISAKNSKNIKTRSNSFKSIENLNAGIYIFTPIFLGLIVGYYLDIYFEKKPFFIVLFIILGTLSSFYNLYKLTKQNI